MAEPNTLRDFIRDYQPSGFGDTWQMLELWNHGGSFVGFGHDESSDSMMSLQDIQDGVKDGLSGISLSKFDIIGFDACLMANFEVFLALSPYTKYIVASEDVEPGFGWDYTGISSTTSALEDYGESIINSFVAQGKQNPRTLGLYDMEFFTSDFKGLFDTMVTHLTKALQAKDEAILSALNAASFYSKKVSGGGIDLGEFLNNLDAGLPYDCRSGTWDFKVTELIDKYAPSSPSSGVSSGDYLVKFAKNGESGDRHTGVTIFWPTSSNINSSPSTFDRNYLNLPNFGQSGWLAMIKLYHTLRNTKSPSMTVGYCQGSSISNEIDDFTTSQGTLSALSNGLRVSVTASDEVGDSYSEWGIQFSDGSVLVFSSNDGTQSGSSLLFNWDRQATFFDQDDKSSSGFSYSFYDDSTGEKEIYIPLIYYSEDDIIPTTSSGRYTGLGGYAATLYLKILANGATTETLYVAATKDEDSAKAEVSRDDEACASGCGKILTIYYTNNIDTFDQNNVENYGELFDWKDVVITRGTPEGLSSGSVVCYIQIFAIYRAMWTYQILENIRESSTGVTYTRGDSRLSASSGMSSINVGSYAIIGGAAVIVLCCAAAVFYFMGFGQAVACASFLFSQLGGAREIEGDAEMTGLVPDNIGAPKDMLRPGL